MEFYNHLVYKETHYNVLLKFKDDYYHYFVPLDASSPFIYYDKLSRQSTNVWISFKEILPSSFATSISSL